jgi:hypothetical protein
MSSYQRLIVHRVAQYFKLEHLAVESEEKSKRAIVLIKTSQSRVYAGFRLFCSLLCSWAAIGRSCASPTLLNKRMCSPRI